MIPHSTFPLFMATAALLIVAPGPDTLFIMARSIGQGRDAGVVSALGIFCGALVHITAATLGLSALLLSSAVLFTAVKWLGAAYLVYLGVRMLATKPHETHLAGMPKSTLGQVFHQGAVTNILNPKVALFFVALLPQFVDQKLGHIALQVATLGIVFNAAGTVWNIGTALWAGAFGAWTRRNPLVARVQQRLTGAVFVGLGVRMALISRG